MPDSSTSPSPKKRVVRTVFQVAIAVCAAIPTAVGALGLPADKAAAAIGVAGFLAVIISAVHNAWDSAVGNS